LFGQHLIRKFLLPAAALALVLGAWAGSPSSARADNLDEELLKQAREVLNDLNKQGYRNVGVLKFRVRKGNREPSFQAGLLSANLATRLENALALASDGSDSKPIGITRGASQVAAAKDRKASYLSAAGRASLFQNTYPLAWGQQRVAVDAFLTGLVEVSADLRQTKVTLQVFDQKNPAHLRDILHFTVPTDRSMLADLGESFVLPRRAFQKRGPEQDQDASDDAHQRDEAGLGPDGVKADEGLVELEVYYDNVKAEVTPDLHHPGEKGVPEPKAGQAVHFLLRNKSPERLAVVLRVNGVNTVHKEENREVGQFTKWVLEPNKDYAVRGFYLPDGLTVERYKVLSDEESQEAGELSPAAKGLIELDVFREGGLQFARRKVSLRGLSQREWEQQPPQSLAELKAGIRRAAGQAGKAGLIVPGERGQESVKETEFQSPIHAYSMTIRYYPRKGL
jgi:hypothetical protein